MSSPLSSPPANHCVLPTKPSSQLSSELCWCHSLQKLFFHFVEPVHCHPPSSPLFQPKLWPSRGCSLLDRYSSSWHSNHLLLRHNGNCCNQITLILQTVYWGIWSWLLQSHPSHWQYFFLLSDNLPCHPHTSNIPVMFAIGVFPNHTPLKVTSGIYPDVW